MLKKILARRSSNAPTDRPNKRPGQNEVMFEDELVRTYAPLLLRPWVMRCVHKDFIGECVYPKALNGGYVDVVPVKVGKIQQNRGDGR